MNSGLHICLQVTRDCSLVGKRWQNDHGKGWRKAKFSFIYGPSNCYLYSVLSSNKLQLLLFFFLDLLPSFFHSSISSVFLPLTFFSGTTDTVCSSLSSIACMLIYQK